MKPLLPKKLHNHSSKNSFKNFYKGIIHKTYLQLRKEFYEDYKKFPGSKNLLKTIKLKQVLPLYFDQLGSLSTKTQHGFKEINRYSPTQVYFFALEKYIQFLDTGYSNKYSSFDIEPTKVVENSISKFDPISTKILEKQKQAEIKAQQLIEILKNYMPEDDYTLFFECAIHIVLYDDYPNINHKIKVPIINGKPAKQELIFLCSKLRDCSLNKNKNIWVSFILNAFKGIEYDKRTIVSNFTKPGKYLSEDVFSKYI